MNRIKLFVGDLASIVWEKKLLTIIALQSAIAWMTLGFHPSGESMLFALVGAVAFTVAMWFDVNEDEEDE